MQPRFPKPAYLDVLSLTTGRTYGLVAAEHVADLPRAATDVTRICNEARIYDELFRRRLAGRPYTGMHAAGFLAWAREGWQQGTHFVFFLMTPEERIAGALDIKSSALDGAEIGYWASSAHKGIMTGGVASLRELAARAGYQALYARVRQGNIRSSAVLRRNGFTPAGAVAEGGVSLDVYIRSLEGSAGRSESWSN